MMEVRGMYDAIIDLWCLYTCLSRVLIVIVDGLGVGATALLCYTVLSC
jgi:hypothetical protein